MIVSISPVGKAKFSNHPDFFMGTTFWGESFNSYEELCAIVRKHAYFDGKWHPFEMGFMPDTLKERVRSNMESQFAESDSADLVKAFSIDTRELRRTRIYGSPGIWVIERKGELIQRPGVKLLTVLQEVGIF